MALLEDVRGCRLRITGGKGINQQLPAHRRYVVRFGGLSPARGRGTLRTSFGPRGSTAHGCLADD